MKILVIYADSGAGHRRAAESIGQAVKRLHPAAEVTLVNSLSFSAPLFRWAYPRAYLQMVNYFPPVWGLFYYLTDNRSLSPVVKKVRRLVNYLNSKKLVGYLRHTNPSVIISTHFYASEVVADLKRKGERWPLVSVITDYRLHRFWMTEPANVFVVGAEETKADLVREGVPEEKIKILGIPISPAFCRCEERGALFRKLGLDENLPTVLLVSGGFGVGPIAKLVRCLGNLTVYGQGEGRRKPLQLLVVCGRKEVLYYRIRKLCRTLSNPVKIYRFVDNMHELMEAADLLIGKAGGLTVAEALAKNLPMLVIAPIPGQELRNCDLMRKWKVAVRVEKIDDTARAVSRLCVSPSRLESLRRNVGRVARPSAAAEIGREALRLIRCS